MLLRDCLLEHAMKLRVENNCVEESSMAGTYRSCWTQAVTSLWYWLVWPTCQWLIMSVVCVHGNTLFYLAATVELRMEPELQISKTSSRLAWMT